MAQKRKKNKLLTKQFSYSPKIVAKKTVYGVKKPKGIKVKGVSRPQGIKVKGVWTGKTIYSVFKKGRKRGSNKQQLKPSNLQKKTLTHLNKVASKLGIPAQNLDQFRRTAIGKNKISTGKSLKTFKQKTNRLSKSSNFKQLAKSFSLTAQEAGVEGLEDNTIENLRGKLFENQEQFYQENKEWLKRINELNSKASLHWKQERELENLQEAMRREYAKKVEQDEKDFNKRLLKTLFG